MYSFLNIVSAWVDTLFKSSFSMVQEIDKSNNIKSAWIQNMRSHGKNQGKRHMLCQICGAVQRFFDMDLTSTFHMVFWEIFSGSGQRPGPSWPLGLYQLECDSWSVCFSYQGILPGDKNKARNQKVRWRQQLSYAQGAQWPEVEAVLNTKCLSYSE